MATRPLHVAVEAVTRDYCSAQQEAYRRTLRSNIADAIRNIPAAERKEEINRILAELDEQERRQELLSKLKDVATPELERLVANLSD
jgi:hypothetical protein